MLLLVVGNGIIERGDSCIYAISLPLTFAVLPCDCIEMVAQFCQVIGTGFEFAFLCQLVVAGLLVGPPINGRKRAKL